MEALIYRLSGLSRQRCPHEPWLSFIYTLEVAEDWILSHEVDQFVASQHMESVGSDQGVITRFFLHQPRFLHTHKHMSVMLTKEQAGRSVFSGPFRSAPVTSGAGACLLQLCSRVNVRGPPLHLQSDKRPSGEPAQLF